MSWFKEKPKGALINGLDAHGLAALIHDLDTVNWEVTLSQTARGWYGPPIQAGCSDDGTFYVWLEGWQIVKLKDKLENFDLVCRYREFNGG